MYPCQKEKAVHSLSCKHAHTHKRTNTHLHAHTHTRTRTRAHTHDCNGPFPSLVASFFPSPHSSSLFITLKSFLTVLPPKEELVFVPPPEDSHNLSAVM